MTSSRDNTSFSKIEDANSESQSLKENAKMPNESSNTICNNNESQSKSHFQKIMGSIFDSEQKNHKSKSIYGYMNPPQKQTIPIFQIISLVFGLCSTIICFRASYEISCQQMQLYSLQEKILKMEAQTMSISNQQKQQNLMQEKILNKEAETISISNQQKKLILLQEQILKIEELTMQISNQQKQQNLLQEKLLNKEVQTSSSSNQQKQQNLSEEQILIIEAIKMQISNQQKQQNLLEEKILKMEDQSKSKLFEEMELSQKFKMIQKETKHFQEIQRDQQERIWKLESNLTMLNIDVEELVERESIKDRVFIMEHRYGQINIEVEFLFNQTHKLDKEYFKSSIELEKLRMEFQMLKHLNEVDLDELKQINRMQMNYTDSIIYLTQQSQIIDLKVNSLRKDISVIEDTQSKCNKDIHNLSEQFSNSTELHGPFYTNNYLIILFFGGKDITFLPTTEPIVFKFKGRAIVTLTAVGHAKTQLHGGYLTFLVNRQIQLPKSDEGMYFGVQKLSDDWVPVSLIQMFSLNTGIYEFNLGFFTQSDVKQIANLQGMSISVQITNVW